MGGRIVGRWLIYRQNILKIGTGTGFGPLYSRIWRGRPLINLSLGDPSPPPPPPPVSDAPAHRRRRSGVRARRGRCGTAPAAAGRCCRTCGRHCRTRDAPRAGTCRGTCSAPRRHCRSRSARTRRSGETRTGSHLRRRGHVRSLVTWRQHRQNTTDA